MLIALLVKSNRIKQLMVGIMVTCLIQLLGQICQLIGMSGIMALHVGNQSNQLLHGCMAVFVGAAILMQMLMRMGMLVVMGMTVSMALGVLYAIMGMSMGMLMAVLVVVSTVLRNIAVMVLTATLISVMVTTALMVVAVLVMMFSHCIRLLFRHYNPFLPFSQAPMGDKK